MVNVVGKIKKVVVVSSFYSEDFETQMDKIIDELQSKFLDVEIQYQNCFGSGSINYSALIIGRMKT